MFFSVSFLFVFLILPALWNVEPVLAAEKSLDSGLFEPFTEEEDYVFDEEYWGSAVFYPVPETPEEETKCFGSRFRAGRHIAIGPYMCDPISREEKTAALIHYNRARGDIVIPEEVKEYQIIRIGLSAEEY